MKRQTFDFEGRPFERIYAVGEACGEIALAPDQDDFCLVPYPTDALAIPDLDPYIAEVILNSFAGPQRPN